MRVGRGERVPQIRRPVRHRPVALYGVRRRGARHADPPLHRVRPQAELAVGGPAEEAAGHREVVGGQLVRRGQRVRVGERQEHHHRVQPSRRTRIGRVPGVQALRVMGVGPGQRAGLRREGLGTGRHAHQGGRRERRHRGAHRRRGPQPGPHTRTAEPLPQCLTTESSRGELTRHGDLRETVRGTPHPEWDDLSYCALFSCTGRVRTAGKRAGPRAVRTARTHGTSQLVGAVAEGVHACAETIWQRCGTGSEAGQWLEGPSAGLYDRHTFRVRREFSCTTASECTAGASGERNVRRADARD